MIYDVYPNDVINKAAEELKRVQGIKPPEWAKFVKTGTHKERAPSNEDWWYIRTAAVLRSVQLLGPIGVSKLRTKYGGKKRRGHKPSRFKKGSGNIIRKILQQLEKTGFVKFAEKGVHKGRVITPKGVSFLNMVAAQLMKGKPKIKDSKVLEFPKEKKPKKIEKEEIPSVDKLVEETKKTFKQGKKVKTKPSAEELIEGIKK